MSREVYQQFIGKVARHLHSHPFGGWNLYPKETATAIKQQALIKRGAMTESDEPLNPMGDLATVFLDHNQLEE